MSGETQLEVTKRNFFLRPAVFLTAIVFAVSVISFPFATPGITFASVVFISAAFASTSMTAIWCAVEKPWWRFLVALFLISFAAVAVGSSLTNRFDWLGVTLVALTAIPICGTIELTKLFFGRFKSINKSDELIHEGLQFSISQIMIATAAIAIFISVFNFLVGKANISGGTSESIKIALIAATIVAVLVVNTLLLTWSLMGSRLGSRFLATTLFSICLIPIASLNAPHGGAFFAWILLFSVSWIAVAFQLALLRREGIRFVRK